jgi:hypothetical protein
MDAAISVKPDRPRFVADAGRPRRGRSRERVARLGCGAWTPARQRRHRLPQRPMCRSRRSSGSGLKETCGPRRIAPGIMIARAAHLGAMIANGLRAMRAQSECRWLLDRLGDDRSMLWDGDWMTICVLAKVSYDRKIQRGRAVAKASQIRFRSIAKGRYS